MKLKPQRTKSSMLKLTSIVSRSQFNWYTNQKVKRFALNSQITITDYSNIDNRCSEAYFWPLLFYYYCTPWYQWDICSLAKLLNRRKEKSSFFLLLNGGRYHCDLTRFIAHFVCFCLFILLLSKAHLDFSKDSNIQITC